ncbi:CbrC family protein [Streptomyces sp. NPDC056144]|uniref:CbrC family protein n=1 Tax=Streptomyces sp. NPDC056144 TaxID=3345726 RepID=UPI0035DB5916
MDPRGGGRFCLWCMAEGSAAERFAGEFAGSVGLDGAGEDVVHEVTRRTPGFRAPQDPHRFVPCQTAAAFVGEAGCSEPAARPDALARLRTEMCPHGRRDQTRLEQLLTHLGESGAAMLFRCTVCRAPPCLRRHIAGVATSSVCGCGRVCGRCW